MIGYRSQNFKYEIFDYRGMYWTTPVSGEGKVLDYEVTYTIPYIVSALVCSLARLINFNCILPLLIQDGQRRGTGMIMSYDTNYPRETVRAMHT